MKFALAFLLCSSIAETCLPPHVHDLQFETEYECLIKGYEESLNKIIEIGPNDTPTAQTSCVILLYDGAPALGGADFTLDVELLVVVLLLDDPD